MFRLEAESLKEDYPEIEIIETPLYCSVTFQGHEYSSYYKALKELFNNQEGNQ